METRSRKSLSPQDPATYSAIMRILPHLVTFSAILVTIPCLAAAGLKWETKTVSLKAELGQAKVIAHYPFTNESSEPIEITGTQSSCGCTVPSLEKTIYQPGESGVLTAEFNLGSRTGHQRKAIEVRTNRSGEDASYSLALEVDIPQAIKMRRRAMIWKIGDELKTQTGTVNVHPELGFSIEGFKHVNLRGDSKFEISVTPSDETNAYEISVTPRLAESRTTEYITLTSSGDTSGHLDRYRIALYIR